MQRQLKINQSLTYSINRSRQSSNRTSKQPINQFNQTTNQPTNQSFIRSINQSNDRPANQPTNQIINDQSINQSANQPTNQSFVPLSVLNLKNWAINIHLMYGPEENRKSYSKNKQGYIWIWSGARNQETANHSAHFVQWKSSYITIMFDAWAHLKVD